MEGLVKFSFFCFAAASIALAGSALSYIVYGIGRIRLKQSALATSAGTTVSTTSAEYVPGPIGAGRFGTMLAWFAVFFQALAVLFRTLASHRGPYSNMYEFSLAFILAATLIYLLFERMYGVRQLG